MFHFFEKKISDTIHTFFFFGLIAVGLGFLTLLDPLFVRLFIALLCFFVGIIFLYVAYHFQELRRKLSDFFQPIESAIGAAEHLKKPTRKRPSKRKKQTVSEAF
ncbi:MAG: hypothetical protein AAB416_01625 [Patescibacteria group bacterium]